MYSSTATVLFTQIYLLMISEEEKVHDAVNNIRVLLWYQIPDELGTSVSPLLINRTGRPQMIDLPIEEVIDNTSGATYKRSYGLG